MKLNLAMSRHFIAAVALTSMGFVLDTGSRTFAAGTVKLWGIK
jgi:hypothetical protein